jgi:hypothetical protein
VQSLGAVIEHQPDDERSHAPDQVQVTVFYDSPPVTIHWRYAVVVPAILAILTLAISLGISGGAGSNRRPALVSSAPVNDSASVSASYSKSEVFEVRMGVREPDGDEP